MTRQLYSSLGWKADRNRGCCILLYWCLDFWLSTLFFSLQNGVILASGRLYIYIKQCHRTHPISFVQCLCYIRLSGLQRIGYYYNLYLFFCKTIVQVTNSLVPAFLLFLLPFPWLQCIISCIKGFLMAGNKCLKPETPPGMLINHHGTFMPFHQLIGTVLRWCSSTQPARDMLFTRKKCCHLSELTLVSF